MNARVHAWRARAGRRRTYPVLTEDAPYKQNERENDPLNRPERARFARLMQAPGTLRALFLTPAWGR